MSSKLDPQLGGLVALVERAILLMEDAPKHLNRLAREQPVQIRIANWDRAVVAQVREGLQQLISARADPKAKNKLKDAVEFFVQFPSVYKNDYFAQWSTREKELDDQFDRIFELADSISESL